MSLATTHSWQISEAHLLKRHERLLLRVLTLLRKGVANLVISKRKSPSRPINGAEDEFGADVGRHQISERRERHTRLASSMRSIKLISFESRLEQQKSTTRCF